MQCDDKDMKIVLPHLLIIGTLFRAKNLASPKPQSRVLEVDDKQDPQAKKPPPPKKKPKGNECLRCLCRVEKQIGLSTKRANCFLGASSCPLFRPTSSTSARACHTIHRRPREKKTLVTKDTCPVYRIPLYTDGHRLLRESARVSGRFSADAVLFSLGAIAPFCQLATPVIDF